MIRRHWQVKTRAALLVASLVVLACGEDVTAPGSCPAFCPPAAIDMLDTVPVGSVKVGSDSVFLGYVRPQDAQALQLTTNGSNVPFSRAVLKFRGFGDTIILNAGDTIQRVVAQIDSLKINLNYVRRKAGVTGVTLRLYRLLATTDSNVTLALVQPRFDDSTLIGTITLDDTVAIGTVSLVVPATAFPTFHADSSTAAIGVEVRASVAGFVDLGSTEGSAGATIQRYMQVDSIPGVRASRSDAKETLFDTFVFAAGTTVPAGTLAVGGVPSARVMLRAGLPSSIVDSSQIVRATLLLVPVAPVLGALGDTVVVIADGVDADFGAKSPVAFTPQDSIVPRSARAVVGSSDTLRIDITTIVRAWKATPTQPHTLSIRVVPEGAGFGAVWVGSTGTLNAQPAIRVTYINPFHFGSLR